MMLQMCLEFIGVVQTIIQQQIPEAVYCYCKVHPLHLAICHTCKKQFTIAFAFVHSAKRLLAFQESLSENAQVRCEMERNEKLRNLCETRRSSKADALYTFHAAYPVVLLALETLSNDWNAKARSPLSSIKQFNFIIALCAAGYVSPVRLPRQICSSLIEAAKEASVVIVIMKTKRTDPLVWTEPCASAGSR